MSAKYIVVSLDGKEQIFTFPKAIDHDRMFEALSAIRSGHGRKRKREYHDAEAVSAGFVDRGHCWGRSETLNLDSRAVDTALLGMAAAVDASDPDAKGDISAWLRRRAGGDLVMMSGRLAGQIADHIDALAQQPKAAVKRPTADCYSADEGDTWHDCPDDILSVHGLKVGDEYEVLASVRAWTERYRVIKAPDDTSDDYEVERVTEPSASTTVMQDEVKP